MRTFRLVIACPDRVGIVAKVSNVLAAYNGWITEANHHSDSLSNWFFMRHEIRADSLPFDIEGLRTAFAPHCGRICDGLAGERFSETQASGAHGQP